MLILALEANSATSLNCTFFRILAHCGNSVLGTPTETLPKQTAEQCCQHIDFQKPHIGTKKRHFRRQIKKIVQKSATFQHLEIYKPYHFWKIISQILTYTGKKRHQNFLSAKRALKAPILATLPLKQQLTKKHCACVLLFYNKNCAITSHAVSKASIT